MKAVIFDMDGVIIDSEPVHREVELRLFSENGLSVTENELMGYLGMTSRGTFQGIARQHPDEWEASGLTIDGALEIEQQRYWEALTSGRVPFVAGMTDLIRRLADTGWLVAVASSAPRRQILHVLHRGALQDSVTCLRGAEDIVRGKPEPEIFLSAAAGLGVEPRHCWVVEDSPNGFRAAVSAGMPCVIFTGTHPPSRDGQALLHFPAEAEVYADSSQEVGNIIAPTLLDSASHKQVVTRQYGR
jgi:HAD superfamily hydrolase (TIGR01509 family)